MFDPCIPSRIGTAQNVHLAQPPHIPPPNRLLKYCFRHHHLIDHHYRESTNRLWRMDFVPGSEALGAFELAAPAPSRRSCRTSGLARSHFHTTSILSSLA